MVAKLPFFSADTLIISSYVADADLSSYKHRLVKKTSTGVALCGAGDPPLGVLYNAPASGAYADVATQGNQMTGIAAAAITAGNSLKVASNGRLTPASTGDAAIAVAETAAAADGSLVGFTFRSHTAP